MIPYKFFHMNSISFGKYLKYSRACSFCAYFSNGFSLWCPYKETRFGLSNDIAKNGFLNFFKITYYRYVRVYTIQYCFKSNFFNFLIYIKLNPQERNRDFIQYFHTGMYTILHIQLRYSFPPNSNDDNLPWLLSILILLLKTYAL